MKKSTLFKVLSVAAFAAIVFAFFKFDGPQYLNLETLKEKKDALSEFIQANFIVAASAFFGVYVLVTAVSLPGAAVMTLAGGALFGFWWGLILVSFASTLGASIAFLASRWVLRDWVSSKFSGMLAKINEGIYRDGPLYLLSLRLIPLFPFFVINLVMGLTAMSVVKFFIVSQIGMLAGTAAYVFAGTQLAEISSMKDILSRDLLIAFTILGLLPLGLKFFVPWLLGKWKLRAYKKPKSFDFNTVVIGAGSAGLVSSYIAASLNSKVALIEKHKMGGDCLNTGCVPSKALIRSASIVQLAKHAKKLGMKSISVEFDFKDVMARVQNVIKKVEPHDSIERYTKLGVDCIEGAAKILSPYEVKVGDRILKTESIIVATGARPFVPPIKGLKDIPYRTSDNIWELESLPRRLVVLGGGPIGSELAQCFARLGSKVSLIEMGDRILAREDPEVSELIKSVFEEEGVQPLTEHKAGEIITREGERVLICEKKNGEKVEIPFDEILVAVGRKANTEGFGLEELGVKRAKNGTLEVDEYLRTSIPNIMACGDVAGPYQFTHAAAHQAYYAIVNSLFFPFSRVDYRVMPWCTFTDPEVARVGLNEQEAKEKNIAYEIAHYPLDDLDRAIADGETKGFIKILTVPGKDKILGATLVGSHVSNILSEVVLAMKHNLGLNKILGTIHTYPTLAEANRYVAGVWKRQHKPEGILKLLKKYFERRAS